MFRAERPALQLLDEADSRCISESAALRYLGGVQSVCVAFGRKQIRVASGLVCTTMIRSAGLTKLLRLPGELRPELMGHDSKQRAYWLVEAGGGGAGWLLREEGGRQSKTRESLLSCDGTPGRCSSAGEGRSSMVGDRSSMDSSISSSGASSSGLDASLQRLSVGDATSSSSSSSARSSSASSSAVAASLAPKHSRADEREEREEEGAPERGEEGENFYQHQQWTAQASRASGPAAAPTETVQLLAADGEGMAAVTKALFSSAEKRDKELAAVMAPRVLRALAVPQRRKVYGTRRAARPMRA